MKVVTKKVETVVSLAISKFLISTLARTSEAKILHPLTEDCKMLCL